MKSYLMVILSLFAGCISPTDSNSPLSLHKEIASDGVTFSVDINKNTFSLPDTLIISFKVKNNSPVNAEFQFANQQQLAYRIIDIHNQIVLFYPWIVLPATSRLTVLPGETKELMLESSFRDQNGNFINPGNYLLEVFLSDNNSPVLKLNIKIIL